MGKNTGVPYERIALAVFDQLLKQSGVKTRRLEHDVSLPSKTSAGVRHQIDVYWEFEAGGVVYKTLVQAKDWKSAVPQGEIFLFKTVLDDIEGQPRGVFVTRTGYQAGAYEFAKANGIALYEMREPVDSDWDGHIKTIQIEMNFYVPHSTDIEFDLDADWSTAEARRNGLQEGEVGTFRIEAWSNELSLEDDAGEPIGTVHDVIESLSRPTEGPSVAFPPERRTKVFQEPTYLPTGNSLVPRVKVRSIGATIAMYQRQITIEIDGGDVVGLILKNVIDGTWESFDKQLQLRSNPELAG